MARRTNTGKQKSTRGKRSANATENNGSTRTTRNRSKRSLISRLKFW